jgi:hypothetical protein
MVTALALRGPTSPIVMAGLVPAIHGFLVLAAALVGREAHP